MWKPGIILWLQITDDESEEEDAENVDTVIHDIQKRYHLKAKENIENVQEKQKWYYDSKHNTLKVSAFIYNNYTQLYWAVRGSKVLLRNMSNSHRMGGTLDRYSLVIRES